MLYSLIMNGTIFFRAIVCRVPDCNSTGCPIISDTINYLDNFWLNLFYKTSNALQMHYQHYFLDALFSTGSSYFTIRTTIYVVCVWKYSLKKKNASSLFSFILCKTKFNKEKCFKFVTLQFKKRHAFLPNFSVAKN